MNKARLQIAFLTSTDAHDKRSWSGIHYYMAKALERNCGDVHYIGPVKPELALIRGKAQSYLSKKLTGKRFEYRHSVALAKAYGKIFTDKLKQGKYDIIFAPASSSNIAFLETNTPIVYLSDTTFANMIGYYPAYTNLQKKSEDEGNAIERMALAKSTLALFPSEWAANSAINYYGIDKAKVYINPLGANIDSIPDRETVLSQKKKTVCKLLFLGVNWERKGGPIAFDTLNQLNALGIDTELTVCGCVPPANFVHPKMKVISFLNKNNATDSEVFKKLLLESDFLILPSRSECFGVVFCEASAFGLLSIAANTGGISGAVKEGINGVLLPYQSGGKEYAEVIKNIFSSDERYYSLRKNSRDLFESSLNWDKWAMDVNGLIQALLKQLIQK